MPRPPLWPILIFPAVSKFDKSVSTQLSASLQRSSSRHKRKWLLLTVHVNQRCQLQETEFDAWIWKPHIFLSYSTIRHMHKSWSITICGLTWGRPFASNDTNFRSREVSWWDWLSQFRFTLEWKPTSCLHYGDTCIRAKWSKAKFSWQACRAPSVPAKPIDWRSPRGRRGENANKQAWGHGHACTQSFIKTARPIRGSLDRPYFISDEWPADYFRRNIKVSTHWTYGHLHPRTGRGLTVTPPVVSQSW